eukprot:Em0023g581a
MPHLWRKKCLSCECPMSLHIGYQPDVATVKSLTLKDTHDESNLSKVMQKYDWFPPDANAELVELYMKSLPDEYVPAKGTPGALWRIQQYTTQLPAYDFDSGACHQMTDLEKRRLIKFAEKRRSQSEGRGRVSATSVDAKICAGCSMDISLGEVHVVADRLGPDKVWHPRCFKCAECKELLADLIYFASDQQAVYCGRHHGELYVKRCAGCDELIFASTFTHAEGKNWHKEHFCCTKCDEPLQDKPYDAHEDSIYCNSCYSKYAVLCHKCSKPIGLKHKRVKVGDNSWHDSCFACHRCRKDLQHCHYYQVNDSLLCDECMEPVAQCYKCKKGISKAMSFLNHNSRSWHAECFRCILCRNWLIDGQFHDYDDDLMCSKCYVGKVSRRCAACTKPIVGKAIQHGLSAYHPDCFKCAGCGCCFDGGSKVKEKEGRPYCQQCAAEFGLKCASCLNPITGKHTVYNKQPYHLECFTCSKCGVSVAKGAFYEASNGTVLCTKCAEK